MKPKLTIFISSMANGGAERAVSNFLPKLVNDFEVTLFLFYSDIRYDLPTNISIVSCFDNKNVRFISKVKKLFQLPIIYSKYFKHIKNNQPDYCLSLLTLPNIINASLKSLFPETKFLISERCFPSKAYEDRKVMRQLVSYFYNKPDKIFSNSIYINEDLKVNFGVKIDMDVIYNPVNQVESKITEFSSVINIIHIGSMRPVKNHKMLIDAVKEINSESINVNFCGSGKLLQSLKEYVNDDENFIFHGNVSDIYERLRSADIFVLTSNSEGFPNSLLEALSVGLPVISTNCFSGPLEILNDNEMIEIEKGNFVIAKYGILINNNDVMGLKKAILYLVNNPEVSKEIAKKGFRRSKDFNINNIYQNLKNTILE